MHIEKKTLRNIFIGAAVCIILYWLLHEAERVSVVFSFIKNLVSPFVIGAGLAFILNVPMRAFERLLRKLPNAKVRRILSVLLTFVCFALVLFLVFTLLIPELKEAVEKLLPKIDKFAINAENWINAFVQNEQDSQWFTWVKSLLEEFDFESLIDKAVALITSSLESAFSAIGNVFGAVFDAVIAFVFALYCLFQKETLARQGRKLSYAFLPERVADEIVRILRLANATFSNFLSGQCIEVCILGCLFAVTMAIFRMPYIPLISVLVAITAFVPVVGAWVGCAFGAFFIFVEDPIMALWFIVMFVVLQQIENNLIYPRVVGTSIGLSGMWVLVAVAVGGELMGVAGMFLMIPVASVLYTILQEYTNKRLGNRQIDPKKLQEQPPELGSRLKQRRKEKKEKKNAQKEMNNSPDEKVN